MADRVFPKKTPQHYRGFSLKHETLDHFIRLAQQDGFSTNQYVGRRLDQLRAVDLCLAQLPAAGRLNLLEIVKAYVEGRK